MPDAPDTPLRVLVMSTTFPVVAGDGTPEFVLTLSAELARRGHRVTVLVPRVAGGADREVVQGVQVRRFGYFPRRWENLADGAIMPNLRQRPIRWLQAPSLVVSFWWAARREVRRTQADVVHAHWVVPAGLIARLLRRPYLITAHGADAYTLRGAPFAWLKRSALAHASVTVPVSEAIGAELRALGGEVSEAVPMGSDFDAIEAEIGGRRPVPGRIVMVGRLVDKKGVDVLLRAMAGLPQATARIIGDGPRRADLERLAAELGVADRVEFVGKQPRRGVLDALATAAVVALPSKVGEGGDTDGVPVVLSEAVAAGVPVVVSDAGGLGEHVHDGVNGRLVPAGSVERLQAALRDVIADPEHAEAMAVVAREQMVGKLGLDAVGRRYAELLEAAAGR
jgi:glycosyltransferase involved in cell wall biosynthesis